jgi:hypothetical protein
MEIFSSALMADENNRIPAKKTVAYNMAHIKNLEYELS